jgi:hypothetical protein
LDEEGFKKKILKTEPATPADAHINQNVGVIDSKAQLLVQSLTNCDKIIYLHDVYSDTYTDYSLSADVLKLAVIASFDD